MINMHSEDNSIMSGQQKPKQRKRDRITYSQRQLDLLEDVFRQTKYPDYDVRVELERQSKLSSRRILVWFKNRRVRYRVEEGPVMPIANVQRKPKSSRPSQTPQRAPRVPQMETRVPPRPSSDGGSSPSTWSDDSNSLDTVPVEYGQVNSMDVAQVEGYGHVNSLNASTLEASLPGYGQVHIVTTAQEQIPLSVGYIQPYQQTFPQTWNEDSNGTTVSSGSYTEEAHHQVNAVYTQVQQSHPVNNCTALPSFSEIYRQTRQPEFQQPQTVPQTQDLPVDNLISQDLHELAQPLTTLEDIPRCQLFVPPEPLSLESCLQASYLDSAHDLDHDWSFAALAGDYGHLQDAMSEKRDAYDTVQVTSQETLTYTCL